MIMANKKGKLNVLLLSLDIIGFAILLIGAALIRFSKDEITSIIGCFVLVGAVAILSITRLIKK